MAPAKQRSDVGVVQTIAATHVDPGALHPNTLKNILKFFCGAHSVVRRSTKYDRGRMSPVAVDVQNPIALSVDDAEKFAMMFPRDWLQIQSVA